ncbi:glycosylphosphatidylinositol-N- acetylglucosaminyltransferase complex, subunit PIG-Q/GPI1, variant 2 [Sarocladium implicatum]|nr:glycosylphosphatidylinositol-N- acetylglucosaminyltransferase complex, subunit PIG-Q/GPI1, variant 2 [Sarocladium implicatum]
MSPTVLLQRVVPRRETPDWHSWACTVAEMRSSRLAVVVLQIALRDGILPPNHKALSLLPDARSWQQITTVLGEQGHTMDELQHYAHILSGQENTVRIERFLEKDSFLPLFLFKFVLRGVSSVDHLDRMVRYCRKWYTMRRPGTQHWQNSIPLLTVDLTDPGHPLRLILDKCYTLEPRLLPDLAAALALMIRSLTENPGKTAEVLQNYQSQCFNRILGLLRQSNYGSSIKGKIPAAYTWAAVEILLNMSESLDKPCMTSLEGFRAIKEIMASQGRDQKDLRIVPRLAKSWPPYIQPGDGMDETLEAQDNWSRSVLASAFMQENGYSKEEADLALDTLQGMAPDGSPTILQNQIIFPRAGMSLWEASIMATRDSIEAWQRFQNCPKDSGAKPGINEYTAMFQKLVYRDVMPSEKALPGDRGLNFPSSTHNSFTELERLRLRPPSVEELYARMRADGVVLDARLLCLLVPHAPSMDDVRNYVLESDLLPAVKKTLLSWAIWYDEVPEGETEIKQLARVYPTFVATLLRLAEPSADRVLQTVERGMGILRMSTGHAGSFMSFFWPLSLKALARNSRRLGAEPTAHLGAILHTVREIEQAGQASLAVLVQTAKTLRRFSMLHHWTPEHQDYTEVTEGRVAPADIERALDKGLGHGLALATSMLKQTLSGLIVAEQNTQRRLLNHPSSPIERMANRQDPVQATDIEPLIAALIYLREPEEAATVLEWSVKEWMDPEVVDALRFLDEDPGFHDIFCLFRKLAEPVLPVATVSTLRAAVCSADSPFLWPDDEEVEKWFASHIREHQAEGLSSPASAAQRATTRHAGHQALRHQESTDDDEYLAADTSGMAIHPDAPHEMRHGMGKLGPTAFKASNVESAAASRRGGTRSSSRRAHGTANLGLAAGKV